VITLATEMSAAGRQKDERRAWLVIGATLAGACLLVALAGSSLLLKSHGDFVLILILLSAFALIDQALKLLPLKEVRLASGLSLSAIAMVMLFCH
jgi:hypothetical protein